MKYSVINPDLASSLGFTDLIPGSSHDLALISLGYGSTASLHRSARDIRIGILERLGRNGLGARHAQMAAAFAMEARDPTADKRVAAFCASLPEEQFVRGDQTRLLIRRAMEGKLPASVQWNTRRGRQSADLMCRLVRSKHEIEIALAETKKSALAQQWLDVPRMERVSKELLTLSPHQASKLAESGLASRTNRILLRGLSFGLFLSRFD